MDGTLAKKSGIIRGLGREAKLRSARHPLAEVAAPRQRVTRGGMTSADESRLHVDNNFIYRAQFAYRMLRVGTLVREISCGKTCIRDEQLGQ